MGRSIAANRTITTSRTAAANRMNVGGSLLENGNFRQIPSFTAATTTAARWINGQAAGSTTDSTYRWALEVASNGGSARLDNTRLFKGLPTLRLSTGTTTGIVRAGRVPQSIGTVTAANMRWLQVVEPNTSYTLEAYCATDDAQTNAAYIRVVEINSGGSIVTSGDTNKLSGANDFTKLSRTFTTSATTRVIDISPRNDQTGKVSNAWFGDVVIRKTQTPSRPVVSPRALKFGVNTHAQTDTFGGLADAGLGWIRADFNWNNIEATEGAPDWTTYDAIAVNAAAAGVNVLAVLTYTPSWANGGNEYQYPPTDNADFAAFCAMVVERYAPLGIMHYEIWNEPNLATFWKPTVNAVAYANLLREAYTTIKAVNSDVTVILGGITLTTTSQDSGSNVSANIFLRRVYATIGADYFDIVAYHPYDWSTTAIAALRQVMVDNGDSAKKVWFTEFGKPTSGTNGQDFVSAQAQANLVRQAIRDARAYEWVDALFFYELRDSSNAQPDREGYFGLTTSGGSKKASYIEAQHTIAHG